MRPGWRQIVSVFAMYIIALSTILSTMIAPLPASAAADPFSVICHSVVTDAATPSADPAQDGQPQDTGKACFHCTLCCAAPAAAIATDTVLAGYMVPGRLIGILIPPGVTSGPAVTTSPHLARGPPHTV